MNNKQTKKKQNIKQTNYKQTFKSAKETSKSVHVDTYFLSSIQIRCESTDRSYPIQHDHPSNCYSNNQTFMSQDYNQIFKIQNFMWSRF
jgi:hypothetical protein